MTMTASQEPSFLTNARKRVLDHRLYAHLDRPEHVQIFMKHHAFAVWDFFSLLKRLQREVTCVTVPWMSRHLEDHARFITEIVLAEECDEGLNGSYQSHFELYLLAMAELGADRGPITRYIDRVSSGQDPIRALDSRDIPPSVRNFTAGTLHVATDCALHEVAASFCHARENLLFDVFTGARGGMVEILARAPTLRYYLERHIALDHDEHGPLSLRLLDMTCAGDPQKIEAATRVAIQAIEARCGLWDGVLAEIEAV
jgi:hypothetical protein